MPTPLIVFLILLGLLGVLALSMVLYRRRQLHRAVREQFRSFRAQAVSLMDQLDALRQRHKALTSTDPDFQVPMAGATARLYEDVDRDLDTLWERWLQAMEIWGRVEIRLGTGGLLSTGPSEEVRQLLEEGTIEALVRETGACRERLDRLNQAHEQAQLELQEVRHELAAVQHTLTSGAGLLLPTDRHHNEVQTAERAVSEAELKLAADPVGAIEILERTRRDLNALAPTSDRGWRSSRDAPGRAMADELSAAVARLRSAAGGLWSINLFSLLIRGWAALAALSLLALVVVPLLPIAFFLLGAVLILAFSWFVLRAQCSWFLSSLGRRLSDVDRRNRRF